MVSIILLIVTPIVSHHDVTTTTYTYKNVTKLVNETVPNRTMEDVNNLSQQEYTKQVEVPGDFESSFNTTVNLTVNMSEDMWPRIERVNYKRPQKSVNSRAFEKLSYTLSTTKTLWNVQYSEDMSTVNYTQKFGYSGLPSSDEMTTTLNYPMMSVDYQMNNMPMYMQYWQTLAQIAYKMYN